MFLFSRPRARDRSRSCTSRTPGTRLVRRPFAYTWYTTSHLKCKNQYIQLDRFFFVSFCFQCAGKWSQLIAMAKRRDPGYYVSLSSPPELESVCRERKTKVTSTQTVGEFEVERLLEVRQRKVSFAFVLSPSRTIEQLPPSSISLSPVKGKLEYLVLWKDYSVDEASWEPPHHISNHLVAEFLSPAAPPSDQLHEAAHLFCCRVQSTLSSSKQQTVHLPLSRAMFRHLFKELDACASSSSFHAVDIKELGDHFPNFMFKFINHHGQG